MRLKVFATVRNGLICWTCHYCHTPIDGAGVAALRLEDVTAYWIPTAAQGSPRAHWYVCHDNHEVLLLEDRHYASGRHATARAVQETVSHDENGLDVDRINLNELTIATIP